MNIKYAFILLLAFATSCTQKNKSGIVKEAESKSINLAEAARMLSCHELNQHTAVIAPNTSADLYGLSILNSMIQDNHPNLTTFIVVMKRRDNNLQMNNINKRLKRALRDIIKIIINNNYLAINKKR